MTIKVGINGFGRIGRQVYRAIREHHPDRIDVVAVNDVGNREIMTHLLKYDTNYGRFRGDVRATAEGFVAERKSGKTRKGNKWLRMAMIEAGQAAARTTDTALSARHRRIMRHRGYQRAVVAVGHEILVIAHALIARGTTYQELGPGYFDRRQAERTIRRCVRTLERLGHKVTLELLATAA